jgi:hypothetical protein
MIDSHTYKLARVTQHATHNFLPSAWRFLRALWMLRFTDSRQPLQILDPIVVCDRCKCSARSAQRRLPIRVRSFALPFLRQTPCSLARRFRSTSSSGRSSDLAHDLATRYARAGEPRPVNLPSPYLPSPRFKPPLRASVQARANRHSVSGPTDRPQPPPSLPDRVSVGTCPLLPPLPLPH